MGGPTSPSQPLRLRRSCVALQKLGIRCMALRMQFSPCRFHGLLVNYWPYSAHHKDVARVRRLPAEVFDRHRAAQVVHLRPQFPIVQESFQSPFRKLADDNNIAKFLPTASALHSRPCEGGRARQRIGRGAAATQRRGTLPAASSTPAHIKWHTQRACVRSTFLTSSAESLSPICPPVQSSVSIRNSSPSCTVPTCAASASLPCCAPPAASRRSS